MISNLHYKIQNCLHSDTCWDLSDGSSRSIDRIKSHLARFGEIVPYKIVVPEREYLATLKGGLDPVVRVAGDSAIQFYFPSYEYKGPNVYALSSHTLSCFSTLKGHCGPFNGECKRGEAIAEVWNTSPIKEMYGAKAVISKEYLALSYGADELALPARRLALMYILDGTGLSFEPDMYADIVGAAVKLFSGNTEAARDWLFKPCLGLGGRPCDTEPGDVMAFINRLEQGSLV